MTYYHASPTAGLRVLEPRVSEHGEPLIYFSSKRENTLVYLGNPVARFCREAGLEIPVPCPKWATYGFDCAGLMVIEEYYPDYLRETYQGTAGYLYAAETVPAVRPLAGILDCFVTDQPVPVEPVEYVPDAYQALLDAAAQGKISLRRYADSTPRKLAWIQDTVRREYAEANGPEYRAFLREKFPFL